METKFKIGMSAAASWAWGTSLIVGMQIAQQKGLIAWSIWAIANFLTLALFGFLTDIGLLGRWIFNKKPIKICALIIQIFCLIIQLNIIYQVLIDLGFGNYSSYFISVFIGLFFILIMYTHGLSMSIKTDVWQWILCMISIVMIIIVGYFYNVPKIQYPNSTIDDIMWGIWSAIILFSGPIGDVQHWQRAEISRNTGAYYLGSLFFSFYMILILIMSQFEFNNLMNGILLFAVLCVTTSTIDSIAVALHEISNKTIGTGVAIIVCLLWGIFVEFGILQLWSYAGIFRVGFALVIMYLSVLYCFFYNKSRYLTKS